MKEKKTVVVFLKENWKKIGKGLLIVGGVAVGIIGVVMLVKNGNEEVVVESMEKLDTLGGEILDGIEAIGDAAENIM